MGTAGKGEFEVVLKMVIVVVVVLLLLELGGCAVVIEEERIMIVENEELGIWLVEDMVLEVVVDDETGIVGDEVTGNKLVEAEVGGAKLVLVVTKLV